MINRKYQEHKASVGDAISGACSDLASLAEECREVVDNVSGTPLENTQRNQTMGETADTLEGISEPDVDDARLNEIMVSWQEIMPRSKRAPLSRSDRRDNACAALDAALNALTEKKDALEEADKTANDELLDVIDSLITDVEQIKDEAEGVEFPGMRG